MAKNALRTIGNTAVTAMLTAGELFQRHIFQFSQEIAKFYSKWHTLLPKFPILSVGAPPVAGLFAAVSNALIPPIGSCYMDKMQEFIHKLIDQKISENHITTLRAKYRGQWLPFPDSL